MGVGDGKGRSGLADPAGPELHKLNPYAEVGVAVHASGSAPGSLMAYHGSSVTHSHFCSTTKRPSAPWSQTTMPVPRHAGQSGFALGFCSIVASPIRLCHLANLTTNVPKTTMSDAQKAPSRQKLAATLVPAQHNVTRSALARPLLTANPPSDALQASERNPSLGARRPAISISSSTAHGDHGYAGRPA